MNGRRGFLLGLGAAVATPVIVRASSLMKVIAPRDVAALLDEDMANSVIATGGDCLLTTAMITREAIRLWMDSNLFIRDLNLQYDDQFARSATKIGREVRIILPRDYVVA